MSNPPSTLRLSRSSVGGHQFKDSRPLSDPSYQRDCQEKVFNYLSENDFQINKQSLLKLSLSDVTRIFQFLFSFIDPNIEIRNGRDTSLDVVVPKMMAALGFPYTIKKSDLTSFSGSRHIGSVLSMFVFIIRYNSYNQNLNPDRYMSFENIESSDPINFNIAPHLIDLLKSNFSSEIDEETNQKLDELCAKFYGTQETIENMEKVLEENCQALVGLEEEISVLEELPKKKKVKFIICSRYLILIHLSDILRRNRSLE